MKKRILGAAKIIFALGFGLLIVWLSLKDLTESDKESIFQSFRRANYSWVILTMVFGIFSHLLRAIRWKLLLHPMGYKPKLINSFYAVMVGYFANLGIIRSGEVFRCSILYKEEGIPVNKSFGTVIVERTIDMLIFVLLFVLTLFLEFDRISNYVKDNILTKFNEKFQNSISSSNTIIFIVITILIFGIILYASRKKIIKSKIGNRIYQFILGIIEGLKSIMKVKNPILFIVYSFGIWILYFLMVYLCFFSLPETRNLGISAGLSVLFLGSVGIMVTPGGIGIYPVIVAQTLMLYGIERNTHIGDAMGWLAWSAQTIMIIVIGSLSLLIVTIKTKKNEPLSASER